jgi:hypothetical protein
VCELAGGGGRDGVGVEVGPERPVLSVAEVYRLADVIEPRHWH